jgi:indolepyruvate decarboxylase
VFTDKLDQDKIISVTSERTSIRHHIFEGIQLKDFMQGLKVANINKRREIIPPQPQQKQVKPTSGKPIKVGYLFERLNAFLEDDTVVIADPGDAMFAALDMVIHKQVEFLSPAYYTTLGFAVPASIGAQLAKPGLRPLVLVGDGAFQMTGMELSTIIRFNLNPIVVVLNNQGYGTERPMLDGCYNDIHVWKYNQIPRVLDSGRGYSINTEDDLEDALKQARDNTKSFAILDVHLDPQDHSIALKRLTDALGKRVK